MVMTLAARVDELAEIQPDRLAVAFKGEQLSYRGLSQAARAMAGALAREGVCAGDRVVLVAVSKPATIAAYLALQHLGAVTAFADKKDLPERLAWAYHFVDAKLLLADKPLGEHGEGVRTASLSTLYKEAVSAAVVPRGAGAISAGTVSYEKDEGSSCGSAVLANADAAKAAYTPLPTHESTDEGFCVPLPMHVPAPEATLNLTPEETHDPASEELSEILFTSGTTGDPKGVVLSRKAVAEIARATAEGVGYRPDDVVLMPLPLNHSFALRVVRAALSVGAAIVLQNGFTFAHEVERNQELFGCTAITMVPSSVELVSRQMEGRFVEVMGRFRLIEVSSGSLSTGQRLRLASELADTQIWNVWGSTETGGVIFADVTALADEEGTPHIAALGVPDPGVEALMLSGDGTPLPETDREHPGRMALRTPTTMSGYWGREDLTAETLQRDLLITGDLAYEEDGLLFFLGRADDLINVGGEKVSPLEVENAASQSPMVEDCACLGVDDPEGVLGSVPALLVVPRGPFDEEELAGFLAQRLERHKLPAAYLVVDEIPRNRMRKVDRRAVQALWEGRGRAPMNEVVRNLLTRRSVRRFTDDPIDRAVLEAIVRCGYYAPSGHNMQTWHFTVVTNAELIARLRDAAAEAARTARVNFYGFGNPAALVLVSNDSRNPDGCQDASAATENIMLAAWSYEIGSTWLNPLMTLRNVEPVSSLLTELGIPERHTVWSMVQLGHPAADGTLLAKNQDVVTWWE